MHIEGGQASVSVRPSGTIGRASLWRLSQSSSPHKCRSHLGFSLVFNRDLKYGVGPNHLPSGRFAANAAWLAVQVMAHNLARWTARIGLGEQIVTTKTLRRRGFALAGRLTRSARRITLHLPRRCPWAEKFSRALARCEPFHSQPDGAHPPLTRHPAN